jgi:hypothetical protein
MDRTKKKEKKGQICAGSPASLYNSRRGLPCEKSREVSHHNIGGQTGPLHIDKKKLRRLIWCVKKATKVYIEAQKHMSNMGN